MGGGGRDRKHQGEGGRKGKSDAAEKWLRKERETGEEMRGKS